MKVIKVSNKLKTINSFAELRTSSFSAVSLEFVLDIGAYKAQQILPQCLLCDSSVSPLNPFGFIPDNSLSHIPSDIQSHSIIFSGKMNIKKLELLMDSLLYANGTLNEAHSTVSNATKPSVGTSRIYRAKGLIHAIEGDYLRILQAVHEVFEISTSTYRDGSEDDKTAGQNLFIFIGKAIDPIDIERKLKSCIQSLS